MTVPQTGFEANGGTAFTTVGEEASLYAALDSAATVAYSWQQVGSSHKGKPIYRIEVGSGPCSILHVGLQHGREPAGREMLLALLRDMATTTDPAIVSYLSQWKLGFVPTINPDSLVPGDLTGTTGGYTTAIGLNPAWDSLMYQGCVEARAHVMAIRDLAPHVVIDHHEQQSSVAQEAEFFYGHNPNVPTFNDLGDDFVNNTARPALAARGYSTSIYDVWEYGSDQIGSPRTLHQTPYLRGAVGVLVETRRVADPATKRILIHRIVADELRTWHLANHADIDTERVAFASARSANVDPVYLNGADGISTPTIVLDPPPAGYVLTDAQHDALVLHRDLLAIESYETSSGDWFVPLTQTPGLVAAYVMDADSSLKSASATRTYTPPPLASSRRGASVAGLL